MKHRHLIIVCLLSALFGCGGACENVISKTAASPSGAFNAIVFSRNCGATTGFNTQVSVIHSNDHLPDNGGNVYIANGTLPIDLRWNNDSSLEISEIGDAAALKQEKQFSGVLVTYSK